MPECPAGRLAASSQIRNDHEEPPPPVARDPITAPLRRELQLRVRIGRNDVTRITGCGVAHMLARRDALERPGLYERIARRSLLREPGERDAPAQCALTQQPSAQQPIQFMARRGAQIRTARL